MNVRGTSGHELLSAAQLMVADRVLAEESVKRAHVVVYLSGAHAYGFPSPDSDLDLKAIHAAPASALLGLSTPRAAWDRAEVIDGVEIDYTSNELGTVLAGILLGNGNFLERVLGQSAVETSPLHAALHSLVVATLSRRVHRHYRGFATSQWKALDASPTAKKALYVLRTTLTGTHLLRSGEMVTDVTALLDTYGFAHARELIAAKRDGERVKLDGASLDRWRQELLGAMSLLDDAERESILPEEPSTASSEAIESWLIDVRMQSVTASR